MAEQGGASSNNKAPKSVNSLNFGFVSPQDLSQGGVAAVLGEGASLFHGKLFGTRHIGRVSDLLSAKLRPEGLDELKLRAMILFSIFEVYEASVQLDQIYPDGSLKCPLLLECGVDTEKVGVGFVLKISSAEGFSVQNLAERIDSGQIESVIDRLLVDLHRYSNLLILRHRSEPDGGIHLEVTSLLGIPEKMDEAFFAAKQTPFVCELATAGETESSSVKATFVELGDLNYPELLKDDDATRAQNPALADSKTKVTGAGQQADDSVTRVEGDKAETQREVVLSQKLDELQKQLFVVKGGKPEEFTPEEYVKIVGSQYVKPTEMKVSELDPSEQKGIGGLLKKIWPFKKKTQLVEDAVHADSEASADTSASNAEKPAETLEVPEEEVNKGSINPEVTATVLLTELQRGKMDQTLQRAAREVKAIQNELKSERSKKWIDGLMGDLVSEKSRLLEYAKKINTSVRQKELEFKNKELRYQEELRRKDELIRQRSNSLSRAKDQLAQQMVNFERLKGAATTTSTEDAALKQRFAMSQRLLQAVKDENGQLHRKVEDLRRQNSLAQMQIKTKGVSTADFAALQTRYDRTVRQLEEFKRANQQLMDKLSDKKRNPTTELLPEDMKARLEGAMKVATANEKQAEKLQLALDEAVHEQERLKNELDRARAEIDAFKRQAA